MIRLCVICEGPTEAEFVRSCLEPHLRNFGVVAYPSLLKTRPGNKGGGRVTIERVARHLLHEYRNSDRITTLLDLYGFGDSRGRTKIQLESDILTEAGRHISTFDPRVIIPYVQQYEFEGLLFSDVEQFRWVLDGWNEKVREKLQAVRRMFATPEEINSNPESAPSKRILEIFNNGQYSKVEHGPIIASEIGLAHIRAQCPHFNQWLSRLEALKDASL